MWEKVLPRNVGNVDRVLRSAIGVVLVSLVFVGPQTLWGLIGIVPLATAALGTCPLYTLLGISTCRLKPHPY
jgi:hypothetical protein